MNTNKVRHILPVNYRTCMAVVAVALGGVLGTCDAVHAARLLRFEIYLDGQLIMEAVGGDSGRDNGAEVWSRIDKVAWEPAAGYKFPVQQEDPNRALLSGQIVIQAKHASKTVLAEASVPELVLVRDNRDPSRWRLPPEEVTRTGVAAGVLGSGDTQLVGVSPGSLGVMTLLAAVGLLCTLLIVAVLAILLFSRRKVSAIS